MQRMVFNNAGSVTFDLAGYEKLEVFLWERFGSHPEYSSGLHGAPHWLSVYDNASKLFDLEKDRIFSELRAVTLIAAYMHDAGRLIRETGPYADMHHSARSELFIGRELAKAGLGLSGAGIGQAALLARGHYMAKDTGAFVRDLWRRAEDDRMDLCLKIVRDADALDRIRFGGLDTSFLHLPVSLSLIGYITEKWRGGFRTADFD